MTMVPHCIVADRPVQDEPGRARRWGEAHHRGQVIRSGRTLIVTKAEVYAVKDGRETLCALMQQSIMVMHGKAEK